MPKFTFNDEEVTKMFDEIYRRVPEKIPEALDKMADALRPKLIAAAPYDETKHPSGQKHLREVIARTDVRGKSGNGRYVTIFVKPRGIPGAVQGRRAKKNWYKDKQVFKLVVAEYGSSKQAPRPFWNNTVSSFEREIVEIGTDIILSEVDKCGK